MQTQRQRIAGSHPSSSSNGLPRFNALFDRKLRLSAPKTPPQSSVGATIDWSDSLAEARTHAMLADALASCLDAPLHRLIEQPLFAGYVPVVVSNNLTLQLAADTEPIDRVFLMTRGDYSRWKRAQLTLRRELDKRRRRRQWTAGEGPMSTHSTIRKHWRNARRRGELFKS